MLESDAMGSFVSDCVKPNAGANITIYEMLIAFNEYSDKRGWQCPPGKVLSQLCPFPTFYDELKEK